MNLKYSVFYSQNPTILTKTIAEVDGQISKLACGSLVSGECLQRQSTFAEFYQELLGLNQADSPRNVAFCLGVAARPQVQIVPKAQLSSFPEAMARTKDHFAFPEANTLMLLDYDARAGEPALSPEEYRSLLIATEPALADVAMIIAPSASSGIRMIRPDATDGDHEGEAGTTVSSGGLHAYIEVSRGNEIPRILECLYRRLWLAGHGFIKVSTSGALLERGPIDLAVGSPERLIFECRPVLKGSLRQDRPDPLFFVGTVLDVDRIDALSERELGRYQQLVDQAKAAARPMAEALGRVFKDEKVKRLVESGLSPKTAKAAVERFCSEERILSGTMDLQFQDLGWVRIADILMNPSRFHEEVLLDPLDDADSLRWRARLYVNDESIIVHSFDDGGVNYRLLRTHVHLVKGKIHETVEAIEEVLMQPSEPCLYQRGGELVTLESGPGQSRRIVSQDKNSLRLLVSRLADLRKPARGSEPQAADVPNDVLDSLLGKRSWPFPELRSILPHPTLDEAGHVLMVEGYHAHSGLYFELNGLDNRWMLPSPTRSQAEEAYQALRARFSTFSFVSDVDLSVHLAALMTGVLRHSLPTAPMFHYTAPVPGSGKTLLATAVGLILTGKDPWLVTPVESEDESRKRFLALLREGHPVNLMDNVPSALKGDTLCAILTSPTFSDRELSKSRTLNVSTRTLLLGTGNNTAVVGDLSRRVLVCHLDPKCDTPHLRSFDRDFRTDCLEHRPQILAEVMTLLSAYAQAGRPPVGLPPLGSFEDWSRQVRDALVWAGGEDPLKAIADSLQEDDELQAFRHLLSEWWLSNLPKAGVTLRELNSLICDDSRYSFGFTPERGFDDIFYALLELVPPKFKDFDSRALGRLFARHKGRVFSGLRMVSTPAQGGVKRWRVERVDDPYVDEPKLIRKSSDVRPEVE